MRILGLVHEDGSITYRILDGAGDFFDGPYNTIQEAADRIIEAMPSEYPVEHWGYTVEFQVY